MIKKGGVFLCLILALTMAGIFYFGNYIRAANQGEAVINEITWMGTEVSSNNEWIELKNLTGSEINLDGWRLKANDGQPNIALGGIMPANGFFLLERTNNDSALGVSADLIYVGALGNDGEILELYDANGNLIDKIDASAGWPAGDNTTKQTMERKSDGSWQTSADVGGTPKAENSAGIINSPLAPQYDEKAANKEVEPLSTGTTERGSTSNIGDILINEFVADPADGEVEWIELYNNAGAVVDLAGWTIEEGSGARTTLSGNIASHKFIVIEEPKGNLNNKGDIVILRDGGKNIIDSVAYGNWDDGNMNDNAPASADPLSIARKNDGHNSQNNSKDFLATAMPTKNESNIIKDANQEDGSADNGNNNYSYSNNIIISEIFPNPAGDESAEFIELYNQGETAVDLSGWMIGDDSQGRYKIAQGSEAGANLANNIIKAGKYFVIYRSTSKIALNNSGDTVKLYQPSSDEIYQMVKYEKTTEGWSYNYDKNNGNWSWSEKISPGKDNIIKKINHPPLIFFDFEEKVLAGQAVIFDSADTIDEDGDILQYNWDFGDGFKNSLPNPEHTFLKTGAYAVQLTVSDGVNKAVEKRDIKVVSDLNSNNETSLNLDDGNIIINEIFPNPVGEDNPPAGQGEFIELYNKGEVAVNLLNWQVDDSEGGSSAYVFNSDNFLSGGSYFLLNRNDSKITLNNTSDSVRLFNNSGELVDAVEYAEVYEGESYARGANEKWFWTPVITPKEKNIISVKAGAENNNTIGLTAGLNENNNGPMEIFLEEINKCQIGDLVKTAGTVAVKPGILGAQYFYIVGSPGIQVYSYKKDFPDLKVGDYVAVAGEISESRGERRIKTKTTADIKVIANNGEPIPTEVIGEEMDESFAGSLVKISGELTERKSSTLYIDDGTGEVVAYIKEATGIDLKELVEGDVLEITGIAVGTSAGLKVMPRSPDDIKKIAVKGISQEVPPVLGEVNNGNEWAVAGRDKKMELFKYLLIIAGGAIVVLIGFLIKIKRGET
ncbi:hypothetical protein CO115_03545 [Candidatus Falkowbacteria bacterium CG_4_9_14_3_um_filter_36_9]|uniref:PKD domain-containing protein n=2 Tax=Candidatus Falkowiibacteriota TaxID=1752728 RepID=A0A1J4T6I0_9BACT|nr:MAG: hypothetical protein AUJ27_03195 [Candidatus Falkowbacteria bacterium CG1_02_37_44]PIV50502.1 MAG: hypothetical protein COS18_04945 [Candidatus Falkowbacteria bacterium CG02_land_8_20_14_3_00_36_14]PIX10866.1 MAG: hypothetical protein COZ73_04390 [Candidatus Falkowbacteria bacterium CG_4_8_14_3_um_filter_36_11]PJA10135.1 MAG: hypothetical protein COX67_05385 [Candidatus Falkowbacteria bacterium CG_4_10_14_0_2_um_filter_36_22]PJB18909.1 MAG: hypothetical protein CO115_03545 [Candidatus F